jgi:hypothetical protein
MMILLKARAVGSGLNGQCMVIKGRRFAQTKPYIEPDGPSVLPLAISAQPAWEKCAAGTYTKSQKNFR